MDFFKKLSAKIENAAERALAMDKDARPTPEVTITEKRDNVRLSDFPAEVRKTLAGPGMMLSNLLNPHYRHWQRGIKERHVWTRSDGVSTYIVTKGKQAYFVDVENNQAIGRASMNIDPLSISTFTIFAGHEHQMKAAHLLITISEWSKGKSGGRHLSAGAPAAMRERNGEPRPEETYHNAHALWNFMVAKGFARKIGTEEKGDVDFEFLPERLPPAAE